MVRTDFLYEYYLGQFEIPLNRLSIQRKLANACTYAFAVVPKNVEGFNALSTK
jgi:hypothetical protein